MTTKKGADKLSKNLLVPFTDETAHWIKMTAAANGLPNTVIIRLLMTKGMQEVRKGNELKLVVPSGE